MSIEHPGVLATKNPRAPVAVALPSCENINSVNKLTMLRFHVHLRMQAQLAMHWSVIRPTCIPPLSTCLFQAQILAVVVAASRIL